MRTNFLYNNSIYYKTVIVKIIGKVIQIEAPQLLNYKNISIMRKLSNVAGANFKVNSSAFSYNNYNGNNYNCALLENSILSMANTMMLKMHYRDE